MGGWGEREGRGGGPSWLGPPWGGWHVGLRTRTCPEGVSRVPLGGAAGVCAGERSWLRAQQPWDGHTKQAELERGVRGGGGKPLLPACRSMAPLSRSPVLLRPTFAPPWGYHPCAFLRSPLLHSSTLPVWVWGGGAPSQSSGAGLAIRAALWPTWGQACHDLLGQGHPRCQSWAPDSHFLHWHPGKCRGISTAVPTLSFHGCLTPKMIFHPQEQKTISLSQVLFPFIPLHTIPSQATPCLVSLREHFPAWGK